MEAFLILLLSFYPLCSLWPVLHHSHCTIITHAFGTRWWNQIKQNNGEAPLRSLTMLRARPWLKSRKIATINFILNLPQLPKRMKTAQLTFRFPQPPSCLPQCWSASHYLAPLEVRLPPSLLSRAAQRHRAGIIIAPHFEIDDLEASVWRISWASSNREAPEIILWKTETDLHSRCCNTFNR